MVAQSNIIKLLQSLGGMASESYGQGSSMLGQQRKGGQPLLPKPTMSMPHAMSPYAPGNQGGGPMAGQPGPTDSSGPQITPNHTQGVKTPDMREGSVHPAAQLAQYLQTQGGPPTAGSGLRVGKKRGIDAGAFLRGAQ